MRYDRQASPSPYLLRHASSLSLCIYCHDGNNQNAPDVIAPVTYVSDPSGGFFANTGGLAVNTGHNLAMLSPETPPGGSDSLILTCTTCHSPHGNLSYRNLLPNPSGTGNTADVTVVVKQSVIANGSNPSQVYIPSNLLYKSGMSQWCNDCHNNFHGKGSNEEGIRSPWFRHPQDQTLSGSLNIDYQYWLGMVPNRVPVQTPMDDIIPSNDDQVFCLSCHKAHGSANRAGMILSDKTSICQQCHNE